MEQETLTLRVGSRTPVAELASAISHGVYDSRAVVLRAIGHGAIGQAVKAVARSRGQCAERGIDIALVPGFMDVKMDDGVVTGIQLRIITLS